MVKKEKKVKEKSQRKAADDSFRWIKKTNDFHQVSPTMAWFVAVWLISSLVFGAVLYLFYKSVYISFLGFLLGFMTFDLAKNQVHDNRMKLFRDDFRELLYYLSSTLSTGESVQNAFLGAASVEFAENYSKDSYLLDGLKEINKKLSINIAVEDALNEFAKKYDIDDVKSFVDVFATCNRKSGNVSEVVKLSSTMIAEKMETMREVEDIVRAKKNESYITNLSPLAGIVFMNLMSKDYLDIMYTSTIGRIIMTIVLVVVIVSLLYCRKITNIEV